MSKKIGAFLTLLGMALVLLPVVATGTVDKIVICHAAGLEGTTQFVTLELPYEAVFGQAGHFYENGTPRAGHEQDYLGACEEEETSTTVSDEEPTTTLGETTTTFGETTTTTEASTTTLAEGTTTTLGEETTTTTIQVTDWTASAECDSVTVDFNPDEVEGVRVTIFSFGPPIVLDDLLTAPGTYTVNGHERVLLEAVPRAGFVAEPASFRFDTAPCATTTTTTVDPSTTTTSPTESTLPFTGAGDTEGMLALGFTMLGLGLFLVGMSMRGHDGGSDIT